MPTAPLNLRKGSATTDLITVNWDLPASDGDSPIEDYQVWWDDGAEGGDFEVLATSTGNALSFTTSTSLVAGSVYTFTVRAKNNVGYSAYTDPVSVIAGTIPG